MELERSGLRRRLHRQIEPRARTSGLSSLNRLLVLVILAGTAAVILETEPLLANRYGAVFMAVEATLGAIFAVEYGLRIWVAAEDALWRPAWRSRLRFLISPAGLVDLLVLVATLAPFLGAEAVALRLLRVLRLAQIAKLGRMSAALRHLVEAVVSRRHELGLTLMLALGVMLAGATALFLLEGDIQPDKFGSIPRAMWWSVITLTTIGYGDAYPVTPPGKIVAAIVAFAGIGLIAMPTGILASALSGAARKNRKTE